MIGEEYVRHKSTSKTSAKPLLHLSNRCQFPLYKKHFGHRHSEHHRDLTSKKNRRIGLSTLDTHNRLATDAGTQRKLLLCHTMIETKASNVVADDSVHNIKRKI